MVPRATYRLQFHKDFGFAEAASIAPYLAELGISHVYASPYLRARPGSQHGYDITDHNSLNPELGDLEAFGQMLLAFHENGLQHILDYVPNHMGVGGTDNPLWLDVLEFGKASRYASWFDVDWDSQPEYLTDKLLVPFLAKQYGAVLEEGSIELRFDAQQGEFDVWLYDAHKLPVAPQTYSDILQDNLSELAKIGLKFDALPSTNPELWARVAELKTELSELFSSHEQARRQLEEAVAQFRGTRGDLESWHRLDALIKKQCWRPAHFRVAANDINYRRFFNINELAGIRMELPEVFEHCHRFVLQLLKDGSLQGLRVDHVDGLYDPEEYLNRLRANAGSDCYLVVEKILESHEELRSEWPIAGTTGYDFCSLLTSLFVDSSAQESLTRCYEEFTGERRPFPQVARESKLKILENEMAGELEALARRAARLARRDPTSQDFTQNILRRALKEIIACFPVYRTYVDASGSQEADERYIHWAVAQARKNEQELDPSVFDFLEELLNGRPWRPDSPYVKSESVKQFAMKAQQVSGPVMAKGLEDTALYRYNRFVALNEVGSSPDEFGTSVATFHKDNAQRGETWPHTMLATSTHDAKRGEDARARLAALSLVPDEWAARVTTWSRLLRARRGDVEKKGPPAPVDEYLLYQNLVASWPAELLTSDQLDLSALAGYVERLIQATTKSLREARVRSNWVAPGTAYENEVAQFIRDALNPRISGTFLENFLPFEEQIARMGVRNSLAQLVLKMTTPGVPDFYQGSELWNLNLVDPDNRRPVDFAKCQRFLGQLRTKCCADGMQSDLLEMLEHWHDGRIKLAVTHVLLSFRAQHEPLFAGGRYDPLTLVDGAKAPICAFSRKTEKHLCMTVVSLDARLRSGDYGNDALRLEPELQRGHERWKDILTSRTVCSQSGTLKLACLFDVLPAAVLIPLTES
jgi:(1->4)-alpha-D-glucan 1-alpha-D-glucosylmutase